MRRRSECFARGEMFPPEVYRILAELGVEPNGAVLVDTRGLPLECCPGLYEALLLTGDGRFMQFEVDLEGTPPLVCWQDVTGQVDVTRRARGFGTTEGWLAIELFDALVEEGVLRRPGAAPGPQVP